MSHHGTLRHIGMRLKRWQAISIIARGQLRLPDCGLDTAAQDQGRPSEAARMELLIYLRFEVWKSEFETPGSVGIRVPAVPDSDFGPNGEAVTANP